MSCKRLITLSAFFASVSISAIFVAVPFDILNRRRSCCTVLACIAADALPVRLMTPAPMKVCTSRAIAALLSAASEAAGASDWNERAPRAATVPASMTRAPSSAPSTERMRSCTPLWVAMAYAPAAPAPGLSRTMPDNVPRAAIGVVCADPGTLAASATASRNSSVLPTRPTP